MKKFFCGMILGTLLLGPVGASGLPEVGDTVSSGEDVSNALSIENSEVYIGPQVQYPYFGYYRFDLAQNAQLRVEVSPREGDTSKYRLELYRARSEGVWDRLVTTSDTGSLEFLKHHPAGIYYLRMVPDHGTGGPFKIRYHVSDPD